LNPLQLDSKAPKIPVVDYAYNETRFKMLTQSDPEAAARLLQLLQEDVNSAADVRHLATMDYSNGKTTGGNGNE